MKPDMIEEVLEKAGYLIGAPGIMKTFTANNGKLAAIKHRPWYLESKTEAKPSAT